MKNLLLHIRNMIFGIVWSYFIGFLATNFSFFMATLSTNEDFDLRFFDSIIVGSSVAGAIMGIIHALSYMFFFSHSPNYKSV